MKGLFLLSRKPVIYAANVADVDLARGGTGTPAATRPRRARTDKTCL